MPEFNPHQQVQHENDPASPAKRLTPPPLPVRPSTAAKPSLSPFPREPELVLARPFDAKTGKPFDEPLAALAKPTFTKPYDPGNGPPPIDVQAMAVDLEHLLSGEQKNTIDPTFMDALTTTPHINQFVQQAGHPMMANLMQGSARALATRPAGAPDQLNSYTMPVVSDSQTVVRLTKRLTDAKKSGTLDATLKAFKAKTGKSLYAVLGERIRDTNARAKILKLLPSPIDEKQLTRDAFHETLAVNLVYSDDSASKMNAQTEPEEQRGLQPKQVFDSFGYHAGEAQPGKWGLQLRVFTPDPKKGNDQPVVIAFRGTRGISFDVESNQGGATDTVVGDAATSEPGMNMFMANVVWIDRVVKQAASSGRKITFVGHSLGAALAQEAAARYPEHTTSVVTFQGANIPQRKADKVAAYNKANPDQAIKARHYRVEGDAVPTSGTATLPGDIYYFDRVEKSGDRWTTGTAPEAVRNSAMPFWMKSLVGNNLAGRVPDMSTDAAVKGHVTPILSTYIRAQSEQPNDPQRKALLDHGQHDEQALEHQVKDSQGNVTSTQRPTEVSAVFAGDYSTRNDPRVISEASRTHALPEIAMIAGGGAQVSVFQKNIAESTALGHLYEAAGDAKDFEAFQEEAAALLSQGSLSMLPSDLKLAEEFKMDKSPLENVQYAIKDLTGIDEHNINKLGEVAYQFAGKLYPKLAWMGRMSGYIPWKKVNYGPDAIKAQAVKGYNDFKATLSTNPSLDRYQSMLGKHSGGYTVPIDESTRAKILSPSQLNLIWRQMHPETIK